MHINAMNAEPLRAQRMLACRGDESRFRVMLELSRGDRCVTDLARRVGLSQSCTTRHLQALEREGLVRGTRSGKKVFFSISGEPRVVALLAWALPGGLDRGLAIDPRGDGSPPRRMTFEADSKPASPPSREPVETEARKVPELDDI